MLQVYVDFLYYPMAKKVLHIDSRANAKIYSPDK